MSNIDAESTGKHKKIWGGVFQFLDQQNKGKSPVANIVARQNITKRIAKTK
jgi:hypothetical protein